MKKLEDIENIGIKTKEQLNKLEIYTIEDLITYYPKRYEVIKRTNMTNIENESKVIIDGIVETQPIITNINKKLKKIVFRLNSNNNIYTITVFNQIYLYHELKIGMKIIVIGKINKFKNLITANEIRFGILPEKEEIESIYYTKNLITRKNLSKIINNALKETTNIKDYIPQELIEKYKFKDKLSSIKEIHNPTNSIDYKKSLQRLKYEELYIYLKRIKALKNKNNLSIKERNGNINEEKLNNFISNLPFKLTKDQIKTLEEIKEDLTKTTAMNRLVQGDVGSGKTIVAFIACYINYLQGHQTAMMVPTEILANQHYKQAINLFKETNIKIDLITSSTKNKKIIYEKIKNKQIDFIIGTQSLIQENIIYNDLGLIITDEQHRFGVNQRKKLKDKGHNPDILSMSATPIPRTYALTIYGDMDISNIKTKPTGRKDIITKFKEEKDITEVLTLMKEELNKKHQIYVIAPLIESEEEIELNNIKILKEKMELAFSKIAKIEFLHGKIEDDKKEKIMQEYEQGKIDILISTTVIEVGVNVPNSSMIVIFNANLFGLSTLHQLRGRVGRGDIQSYCILIAKEYSDRLKMLETCTDGFKISEYDFKTRGQGDLFGIRQSGEIKFKLANIRRDFELMKRVKEDIDLYEK